MSLTNRASRIFVCGVAIAIFSSGVLLRAVSQTDEEAVIAKVEGSPIRYKDVAISMSKASARYTDQKGHAPRNSDELREVAMLREELERKKLSSKLRGVVASEVARRLNVEPKPAEIEAEAKIIRGTDDFKRAQSAGGAAARVVADALDEVCEHGADPDQVYSDKLDGVISRLEWDLRLKHEKSPEKRKALHAAADLLDQQPINASDMAREQVRSKKLQAAIEAELESADPEFAEYMRMAADDPANPKLGEKSPNFKNAKIQEWWQRQYEKADVQILDPRFESVLKNWQVP